MTELGIQFLQATEQHRTQGHMFWLHRVKKGTMVLIPILAVNRDKSIWGQDSMEFMYVYVSLPHYVLLN